MTAPENYNPLGYRNLGNSVITALLRQTAVPLGALSPFLGAGVYVIYYTGDFPAYAPVAARNQGGQFSLPIYVGKAVPAGASTGGRGVGEVGSPLYGRLSEHRESVASAQNLRLEDFYCRFLVVDDVWIPLAESMLIEGYKPLWNVVVRGFGNHDPGAGRRVGQRPVWDMLHPGRYWAELQAPNRVPIEAVLGWIELAVADLI